MTGRTDECGTQVLQASEHAHRGAAAGVWCRKQGPSEAAQRLRRKRAALRVGARGPGGGGRLPGSAACLWLSGFCLRPPSRGASASPKPSQRASYLHGLDKRRSLHFLRRCTKNKRKTHKKCIV